jgi:rRNA processing protein Gar1
MSEQQQVPIRAVEVGDVVVVAAHRVGEPERIAEIVEVLGDAGRPHFRVRWDDGRETIFYPGSDAIVRRAVTR